MSDFKDLEMVIDSATPIIAVETADEARVLDMLRQLSTRKSRVFHQWTITEGTRPLGVDMTGPETSRDATDILVEIKRSSEPGVYVLLDFHPFMDDPIHIRLLKDIALRQPLVDHAVVLISHKLDLPKEIERYCARFEFSIPGRERVRDIVLEEAQEWSRKRSGRNVRTNRQMLSQLVETLTGLTAEDARHLARGAIGDGAIEESDLTDVMKAKFAMLSDAGVLSFEYDVARFAEVGGLEQLKSWLDIRRPVFSGELENPGLDPPKGVLLLGVQGCGKSLAAKAIAGSWHVPLLRLDFATLYNKYHGETERNLRESLKVAEAMEPCILWIDEIEKGVATTSSDGGTSRRVLGTLLTWMAENTKRVFIVATANDIESLPPELLRKGRVDEIFFVDLPDEATRAEIIEIHVKRRDLDEQNIDIPHIAAHAEGFSGAELEQLVVASLYSAHARQMPVGTELLLEEMSRTRPLSVVMAEQIASLRHWAESRTVPAQ